MFRKLHKVDDEITVDLDGFSIVAKAGEGVATILLRLSPKAEGVYHAFGFSGHGFQLVPIVGAIIADLIIHNGTNRKIESFSAERLQQGQAVA